MCLDRKEVQVTEKEGRAAMYRLVRPPRAVDSRGRQPGVSEGGKLVEIISHKQKMAMTAPSLHRIEHQDRSGETWMGVGQYTWKKVMNSGRPEVKETEGDWPD